MPNIIMADQPGGGPSYTEISAISIVNDANQPCTIYNKMLFIAPAPINKFDVVYKLLSGNTETDNDIILCKCNIRDNGTYFPASPFIQYTSQSGATTATKEILSNGYAHISGTFNSEQNAIFIGGWNDTTYSKTNAIKSVKFWDANDNLLFDGIPVLDGNNNPALYNKVTMQFLYNYLGYVSVVAGEAV